jgi:hypothetical protein
VDPRGNASLSEEENTEDGRLEKEGKNALHREDLPYDPTGKGREGGPVRTKLKLEGNTGYHANGEVQREDLGPEASGDRVPLVAPHEVKRLEHDDQRRQPHREDGEQVMEHHRKRELIAVGNDSIGHDPSLRTSNATDAHERTGRVKRTVYRDAMFRVTRFAIHRRIDAATATTRDRPTKSRHVPVARG